MMEPTSPTFSAAPTAGSALPDGRVLLDGSVLKGLRKHQGLSQETLADACLNLRLCVSIASIKRAETGKPVLYRTARHLASAFGVDVSTLLGAPSDGAVLALDNFFGEARDNLFEEPQHALTRYLLELCFVCCEWARTEEMEQLVLQFGGVLVESGGGLLIARFGSSQAYGSDSERALRCALMLSREQWVRAGHVAVLRLVREGEALPDEVVALARQETHTRHGNAPVQVARELIERLSLRFEFMVDEPALPGYRTCMRSLHVDESVLRPLVGRTVELLQFKGIVAATQECQDGHAVYLRGMAGLGKTRLVSEFVEVARDSGMACHRGEVWDFGMEHALWPLAQLVLGLLGAGRSEPMDAPALEAASARLKLAAQPLLFLQMFTGVHPRDESFQGQLALYASMSGEARRQGLLNAVVQLLVRSAVQQPLLLVVEDLHWGDGELFAMLGKLLDATGEAPIIWLLTSRPEGDPLERELRPHCSNPLSLLDLAPIRVREAMALAQQFSKVDPAYRADCVARAQGNPLYLTQLLSSQEGELPDSLRHLVQARVERLLPEQRRALHYAAVFGNRFDLASWRQVLGQADFTPDVQWYQSLLREVEPGSYLFVHDLVMHCLYDAMPQGLRERMHAEVAALYDGRDTALWAQHLLRANAPGAFTALLMAMREKLQDCQYDAVLALGRQSASLSGQAAVSFDLAHLCAQACCGLGHTLEARDHARQALLLATRDDERLDAALGLAAVLNTLDCLDEEERLIERMLPVAHQLQADVQLARLFHLRGNIYFPRGDYAECRRLHEESLSFARVGRHLESQAKALSGIGDSYYAQGDMQTACEVFDQCVRLCERHALVQVEAPNRSARGSARIYLGQPGLALADARQAIANNRDLGNHRAQVFSLLTAAWVLVAAGEDGSAEQELSEALELAGSLGASRFEAILLEGLARVTLRQGDRQRARELIDAAVERVEAFGLQRFVGPWVYGTQALLLVEPQAKAQALERAQVLLEQGCVAHNALRLQVSAAEVWLLAGDVRRALEHGQQMALLAESASCAWVRYHLRLIQAAGQWLHVADQASREALRSLRQDAVPLGFVATMPLLMERLDATL